MKTTPVEVALHSWHTLNAALRGCTEPYAGKLFEAELKGLRRAVFLRRIHSRINRLRAMRERSKIVKDAARPRRTRLRD